MSTKARHYPNMPPLLDGEDNDHYSNRMVGVYGPDAYPYDHVRNRQCALGWHNECSDRNVLGSERRCECPCHEPAMTDPTLTDEELAELESTYALHVGWHPSNVDVPRLIAALRASHQREAEYLEALRLCEQEGDGIADEARASRKEVERLRTELDRANRSGGMYAGRLLPE